MIDTTEPLLDRAVLDENTMSSVPLQEELFVLFFEQSELYLAQLSDALSSGDTEEWRMTAHGVKGASRSLGFTRLASLALGAEKNGPDADVFAALRQTIQDTREVVQHPKEDAA